MSQAIEIKIVGMQEVLNLFKDLPEKYIKAALRKGLRAGHKIITPTAKSATPVKSGALRGAIKTKAGKRSRVSVSMTTTMGEGAFKGKTFYGGFQEFGWHVGKRTAAMQREQRKGMSGAGGRKRIEGKHFMEKAAKRVGQTAGQIMVARTAHELEQAAKAHANV